LVVLDNLRQKEKGIDYAIGVKTQIGIGMSRKSALELRFKQRIYDLDVLYVKALNDMNYKKAEITAKTLQFNKLIVEYVWPRKIQ